MDIRDAVKHPEQSFGMVYYGDLKYVGWAGVPVGKNGEMHPGYLCA